MRFLFLLILLGCSSAKLPPRAKVQELPIDADKSFDYIKAQRTYFKDLFRQQKVTELREFLFADDCLRANKIGDLVDDEDAVIFSSTLLINRAGLTGLCPRETDLNPHKVAWIYCREKRKTYYVTCPAHICEDTEWDILCDQ